MVASSTPRNFPAVIDVTRSISRVGKGAATGVDRVEAAYLKWFLETAPSLYGLARVAGGYVLLDRVGLSSIHQRLLGSLPWGSRDARALIGVKTSKQRGQAEADLRRLAIGRCNSTQLQALLDRRDLDGHFYFNVGHSNLTEFVLRSFMDGGLRTVVFLHDVIPLEHPQFQAPGSVEKFERKIAAVKQFADVVIVNSKDTMDRSTAHLGLNKSIITSHLGIEVGRPNLALLGDNRPYFVTVGTIEPRKNHQLLLDVWDKFKSQMPAVDIPHLHIVGKRGWRNEDVFKRLDTIGPNDPIHEYNDMSDDQLWSLIAGARALLFPSVAEGFGLPSLEAAALGTPVICGDLAIHRELLGDTPVYLNPLDPYLWEKAIIEQTQVTGRSRRPRPHIPTWDEHFSRVNRAMMKHG